MGLFWDLIQQGQIGEANERTESLEARIDRLEDELHTTNKTLMALLGLLEKRFGEDLDQDGRIG